MMSSTQEQMLVEQRVTYKTKSIGAAYFLWFLTGVLGGHRFYLGKIGSGAIMLLLFIGSVVTLQVGTGVLILAVVGFWTIVDAFLIPLLVQDHKNAIRQNLGMQAIASGGQPAAPHLDGPSGRMPTGNDTCNKSSQPVRR